jgi:hypothetical protein
MFFRIVALIAVLLAPLAVAGRAAAEDTPTGKGMTEANKERLVIADMEDISDWYNDSPVETTLSRSDAHVKRGKFALKFANVVDHTKGEENYPVGWPRTGKDLARAKMTDWSGWDFFECWIYTETSRSALPGEPLHINFYHSGAKRSSGVAIKEVRKDTWAKIVIPLSELADAKDVQRVQFNISEANYKHGDRVDFYIDDVVLTRMAEPAIAEFALERKILYSSDKTVDFDYRLAGHKGIEDIFVRLEIGPAGREEAVAEIMGQRQGGDEVPCKLVPGTHRARLSLWERGGQGRLLDRKQVDFRVISGPF